MLDRKADKAIADFAEAIRLDPKNDGWWCGRAVGYEEKGNLDKAIADYTEAIRLCPSDTLVYCMRAAVLAKEQKLDLAIADYRMALRLDRKSAEAERYLHCAEAYCAAESLTTNWATSTSALPTVRKPSG